MQLFGKKKEEPKTPSAPIPYANKDLQEIQKAVEPKNIFPTLAPEQTEQQVSQQNFSRMGMMPTSLKPMAQPAGNETESEETVEEPARQYAPLFVKIDRYRNILNALGQVRTAMVMIHNSFNALAQLENARSDTLKVLEKSLEKVEKKIANLDSELVKPAGYATQLPAEEYADAATIETTIADLRGQIEQLKAELDQAV